MATRPLIYPTDTPQAGFTMPSVSAIRQKAADHNQWMKDLVPKGSFTTPKVPYARPIDAAFTQDATAKTGRFVPGNGGSQVWQRGTGPGATAPPQTTPATNITSLESAFGANSLTNRASANDGAVRTGPISSRKAVPVGGGGRSATDKLGMLARRAWTRQDEKGYTDLIQAQAGLEQRGIDRAFQADQSATQRQVWNARDERNFEQQQQLHGIDRAYQESVYQRGKQDALDAEGRRNEREDQNWQRNRDAELQDRAAGGIDKFYYEPTPDGTSALPMVVDKGGNKRLVGGGPRDLRPQPQPPSPEQHAKTISGYLMKGIQATWDPKIGDYRLDPLRPDKPQSDGTETLVEEPDDAGGWNPKTRTTTKRLMGGQDQGSLKDRPATPTTPTAPASGGRFSSDIDRLMGKPAPAGAMETGRVPSGNYPNDLTPDQSLAAARDHYAATGDDSKIRAHFRDYPSEAQRRVSQPTFGPRVMTAAEALAALNPPPAPAMAPQPRPAVPRVSLDWAWQNAGKPVVDAATAISTAPYHGLEWAFQNGIAEPVGALADYARKNPLMRNPQSPARTLRNWASPMGGE